MNMPSHPAIQRATVSADGRLLSADAMLLDLQHQAGADIGAALAVPQLAAIARVAGRLGIAVSRPVIAAAARGDIDMWVRARPEGDVIQLAVIDWHERPAPDGTIDAASREADLVAVADGWPWQIDTQMRFQPASGGEGRQVAMPDAPPTPGSPFSSYFLIEPDADGDMAILRGFAQRRAFRDQRASLIAAPGDTVILSGFPLFDLAGHLVGYRGRAVAAEPEAAGPPYEDAGQVAALYPMEFGRRLDRSLRQPLGRIIANADSIYAQLEGPLRPDYAGYANDIAAAGRHLMALIDDLADLQAVDRPDFTVVAEDVDLADLARRAAGLLSVKALDRHIRLCPPPADAIVPATGEFRRVLQILVNLTGNAIRYSPEGSDVRLTAEQAGSMARVVVSDQGPGIPAASRERVFEKFERLGRDDPGGSGLGLYISRRLARAMGGDIEIEDSDDQGARFILTLPAFVQGDR
ncbi:MAG: sensor histidine kinase [Sphingobium sp.]